MQSSFVDLWNDHNDVNSSELYDLLQKDRHSYKAMMLTAQSFDDLLWKEHYSHKSYDVNSSKLCWSFFERLLLKEPWCEQLWALLIFIGKIIFILRAIWTALNFVDLFWKDHVRSKLKIWPVCSLKVVCKLVSTLLS